VAEAGAMIVHLGSVHGFATTLALGALATLAAGIVLGDGQFVGIALLLLVAQITLGLLARGHALDAGAPLEAAGLVAVGELSFWAIELRLPIGPPARVIVRRAVIIGALVAGGLALAALLELTTTLQPARTTALTLAGLFAAIATLGLLAALAALGRR
jgi:hypothetical protein